MASNQKDVFLRLVKSGYSQNEANRVVYGWSEPDMKDFWKTIWKQRDKKAPPLEQKEAFYLIAKTSFGPAYLENRQNRLQTQQFKEICYVFIEGIKRGHIYKRKNIKRELTDQVLLQSASTELNRLIKEDSNFKNIVRDDQI